MVRPRPTIAYNEDVRGERSMFDVKKYGVRSSEKIGSNAKFDIYFDQLRSAKGIKVENYLVIRPRLSVEENIVGVCVVPYVNGRYILMQSWRHGLGSNIWQAPAGFVEKGETAVEAALRELEEEVGIKVGNTSLVELGSVCPEPSLIVGRIGLYMALCDSNSTVKCSEEVGCGMPVEMRGRELKQLVVSGKDIGATTLVACYRALEYISESMTAETRKE